MKTLYPTEYDVPGGSFFTTIAANSKQEAAELIVKRKMGEQFHPVYQAGDIPFDRHVMPSKWLELGELEQAMHAAAWLGLFATSSGVATAYDLLHDRGVIHELTHAIRDRKVNGALGPQGYESAHNAYKQLKALEAQTPGFL